MSLRPSRIAPLLALGLLALACRSAPPEEPVAETTSTTAVPVGLDRDEMAASLSQIQARLAAGDAAALDELRELGEGALSYTDAEAASEVARLLVEAGQLEQALDPMQDRHKTKMWLMRTSRKSRSDNQVFLS